MKKNWLITGGCGFLGISLISELIKDKSNNIRIIDNFSTGNYNDLKDVCYFSNLHSKKISKSPRGIELFEGDIINPELAIKVSIGCNIIVHFAANTGVGPSVKDPKSDMINNVIGTFNYLEAARINQVSRFIFASSGAPIGEVEPPIHEELAPHPVSPYGASKLAGEGYCSAYQKTFGIDTIILRFSNIYGPGSLNKSSVVSKFIKRAINNEILEIYGDGMQTRDFIYIDDLIDAVLLLANSKKFGGEIFQIASNHETTIVEIKDLILKTLRQKGFKNISSKNISSRIGDVRRNFSNTKKIFKYLGWQPKVELKDGLSKTINYFLENYKLKN